MPDTLFILLLALVIFGPKKLPDIARQLGEYMAQFKRMRSEFTSQIEREMLKIEVEKAVKNTPDSPVQI